MLGDFMLFIILGPLVGFFIYYLAEDRKRSEKYLDEIKHNSRLVY